MPTFLLHLSSCSLSEISRIKLLKIVLKNEYSYITNLLKKINVLVELGYEQAKACEIVANQTSVDYLRDFFLRFAQSIKVGEDVSEFLLREYESFMAVYTSEYERSMIRLKRLCEAYSAILSSTIFVSVTMVLMAMIGGADFISRLLTTLPLIASVYGILIYMFYLIAPNEKVLSLGPKVRNIEIALKVVKVAVIISIIAIGSTIISVFINLLQIQRLIPLIMTLFGVPLALLGYFGICQIRKVKNMDEKFPAFIATLASSIASLGTSLKNALEDVSRVDFGSLNSLIKKMKLRLEVGVDQTVCWKLFEKESCSELIRSHSEIFLDSISIGAPANKVGQLITNSSLKLLAFRKRREEVAAFLRGIILPLHPALSAIIALVVAISISFSKTVTSLQSGALDISQLQIMNIPPTEIIEVYFCSLIFIVIIANALIMYIVEGGTIFALSYYLGIFLIMGGLIYFVVLNLTEAFLTSIGGGGFG